MRAVLIALALLSAAVSFAQEAKDLQALKEIANSEREDRFEQIARFVERSDRGEDRTAALGLFKEAYGVLWNLQENYYKTLPQSEASTKIEALLKPFTPNSELLYLDPTTAGDLARSLFVASKSERVQRIKELARAAGEDWAIPDDDTTFGSLGCGTYDHTPEHKLYWAVRRYRDEAIQALGQKVGWDGRVKLMEALDDYGKSKADPRLKEIFLRLSEDRNTLVRGEAILDLSAYPGEEAQAVAFRGLTNKAADTRAKSMWLASALKMKTLEAEATRLVDDPVNQVGEVALGYLGDLGTPSAKKKLIETLGNKDLQWAALEAIKSCKCIEASPKLVKLLSDKDLVGGGEILSVLYEIDTLAGTEELERALKTDNPDLLFTAIGLASQIKLQSARASLNRLATHKDEYIRKAALNALQELDKSQ